jgi:hypothetical protein
LLFSGSISLARGDSTPSIVHILLDDGTGGIVDDEKATAELA